MCHSDDSRPPAPPISGEVAGSRALELTAADGTTFAAYEATPAAPNGVGVVILPDVRGLHPYYQALAERFAEAGYHAVAIDWFGRTAGVGDRGDDFDFREHLPSVTPETVLPDVKAARRYLAGAGVATAYTVGFCFGGSQSWRLAASDADLAGTIGFYGRPSLVADAVERFDKPVLLLIAGADTATPREEFDALDARLTELGKAHETYVYEGAPHSFFDRAFVEHAEACDDAWRRILAFTGVA